MVTSLSDFCARHAAASLVMQADRRQVSDRRKTRRGGRRADDVTPAPDALDMRAVAIRRAVPGSQVSSVDDQSQHDSRYAVAQPIGSNGRRADSFAGRRTLE